MALIAAVAGQQRVAILLTVTRLPASTACASAVGTRCAGSSRTERSRGWAGSHSTGADQARGRLVTSYDDARALLGDPRLGKDFGRIAGIRPPSAAGVHATPLAATMLASDPPDHTRLRKLVTKAFTGQAVAPLRPVSWPSPSGSWPPSSPPSSRTSGHVIADRYVNSVIANHAAVHDLDNDTVTTAITPFTTYLTVPT